MNNKSSGQELLQYINNLPISSNGLYDYPGQNVVVPTGGNITMEGIDYPVLGISMETGEQQMMQPGGSYDFPETDNVLEVPQYQNGGRVNPKEIDKQAKKNFLQAIDFEKGYLNSNKIKERMIKSGLDPNKELPELKRLVNMASLSVDNGDYNTNGAYYSPYSNEINYTNNKPYADYGSSLKTMTHEVGHIFNDVNAVNRDFVSDRNTYAEQSTVGRSVQQMRRNLNDKWYSGVGHETDADESVADVHALRQELLSTGYDGRFSNFTNEAYNSMKKIAQEKPNSVSARMLNKIGTPQLKYYNNTLNKTMDEITPEDEAFLKRYDKDIKGHEAVQKKYIFDIMNKIVSNDNPDEDQSVFYAQDGGQIPSGEIPGVSMTKLGKYEIGVDDVNAVQIPNYDRTDGSSTFQNYDDYVLNMYRDWGSLDDFSIVNEAGNEYVPGQTYGSDEKGNYVDMSLDSFFPNGNALYNRTYIPNNIQDQIDLQNTYGQTKVGIGKKSDIPETPYTEQDFEKRREFMKQYIQGDDYQNLLSNYYPNAKQEQIDRLTRVSSVPVNIYTHDEIQKQADRPDMDIKGYVASYGDNYNERGINRQAVGNEPLLSGDLSKIKLSKAQVKDLAKRGAVKNNNMDFPEELAAVMFDGLDNKSVNLSNMQSGEVGVHELGHFARREVSPNQYEDILAHTRNTRGVENLLELPDGRFAPVDYVRRPSEVTSRLDAMRYLLNENGIKDTTKSLKLTEKELEKALKNPKINADGNVKQLIDATNNSQDLLWLLNNIVDNNAKPGQDLRQYLG